MGPKHSDLEVDGLRMVLRSEDVGPVRILLHLFRPVLNLDYLSGSVSKVSKTKA